MNEKKLWYQNLLEQDPGSKIFLSFARELIAEGSVAEAAEILRNGLRFHPEYLEAKLLLFQILPNDAAQEKTDLARSVGQSLPSDPLFWFCWADMLALDGDSRAFPARLMGACYRHSKLTLDILLKKGLEAEAIPVSPQAETVVVPEHVTDISVAESLPSDHSHGASELFSVDEERTLSHDEALSYLAQIGASSSANNQEEPADIALNFSEPPAAPVDLSDQNDNEESESENEELANLSCSDMKMKPLESSHEQLEAVTLRTRSMAEILADQGDVDGALEIYEELAERSLSAEEAAGIARRIGELQKRKSETESSASEEKGSGGSSVGSGTKMKRLLTVLAERFESRTRS
ncbi:MAG: hypothetical protein PUB69_03155 [Desulfovibrionaceae bacterium]|nr:hypothetical protein [Desulfovibrionaceae bacterium]